MRIKRKLLFLLLAILTLPLVLSACYDLGEGTENDDDYCDTYSDISVVKSSAEVEEYSMEDFYNKEAVNDFKTPMEESERNEYSYLIIKVEKDLAIGQIAVFFDSTVKETLSITYFVLDEEDMPIKAYTGEGGKYKLDESNEPSDDQALGKTSVHLSGEADDWESAYLREWGFGNETSKRYNVTSGQYIVLRIDNNCYDRALAALEKAEKALEELKADYQLKLAAWQAVNADSSASQEAKNEAMNKMSEALEKMNIGERDHNEAKEAYERNKCPYQKMPIRMTAILINAK